MVWGGAGKEVLGEVNEGGLFLRYTGRDRILDKMHATAPNNEFIIPYVTL